MQLGTFRYLVGFVILATGLSLVSAQAPVRPKAKEEVENPAKGKKGKPKEEEETRPRPAGKMPLRVPGDETEAAAPKSAAQSSLEEESRRNPYPQVRQFFEYLALPGDIVRRSSGPLRVDPVAEYIAPGAKIPQSKIKVVPRDRQAGLGREPFLLNNANAQSLKSYEQEVLDREAEFRALNLELEPQTSIRHVPKAEILRAAEKALAAGIVYHRIAKTQGKREGEDWAALDRQLKEKLIGVQADQLHLLVDLAVQKKDWKPAFALEQTLTNAYAGSASAMPERLRREAIRLLARHAEAALDADDLDELARRLHALRERFPDNDEVDKILSSERATKSLAARLAQIKSDYDAGKKEVARARLRVIEEINRKLPGLSDLETKLNDQVLYVGVSTLPRELSPALSRTEPEKQALELIYESLVRIRSTPGRERYEPELALEMPSITPLGRRFTLPRNARWSNGKPVMASDVSSTLNHLRQARGRDSEWARLMEGAAFVEDSEHVTLTMKQGFIDPLALMDFKILPEPSADKKEVVGSGPFSFKGIEGEQAVFEANPAYRERSGKEGKPRIREIRFFVSTDPAAEFRQGRLHVLFDLTTGAFKKLEDAGLGEMVVAKQIPNRRIYFLAINHRDNNLPLQNDVVRRGLAHAINREDILDKCFRENHKTSARELRGPFPPGYWPSKPDLRAYSVANARTWISQAKQKLARQTELTLKYPEGDPAVDMACKLIKQQIEAVDPSIPILIKLVPLSPEALRKDVEEEHNYHLAYYSFDFPNLDFRLQPLFDPKAVDKGQSNFLGYKDSELNRYLQEMQVHRNMTRVKQAAYELQDRCTEMMPLIPLWQIDTRLAVHASLRFGEGIDMATALEAIDPHAIFDGADAWFLERK